MGPTAGLSAGGLSLGGELAAADERGPRRSAAPARRRPESKLREIALTTDSDVRATARTGRPSRTGWLAQGSIDVWPRASRVDKDLGALGDVERELRDRYARHYASCAPGAAGARPPALRRRV